MSELRGRFYDFMPAGARSSDPSWQGAKLAVTYHPAFLLRDPRQKGEAWKDLQMVMKYLGLQAAEERRMTRHLRGVVRDYPVSAVSSVRLKSVPASHSGS